VETAWLIIVDKYRSVAIRHVTSMQSRFHIDEEQSLWVLVSAKNLKNT